MTKKYLLFICSWGFKFTLLAQTVVWQMQPSDYDEIVRIDKNLYKVVKNGKLGLINSDGTTIAPIENDNIIGYYEHKAIIVRNDGHGERIAGCLNDEGQYHEFAKKYYTLNGQKFFSDDVISVANESGKVGYIDSHGNEVLGFDGKYDRIKPFVEGYATVFMNKKYYLIDKNGIPVHFRFKSVGEVYGGTNAYKGKVFVWDTDGRFYTYDIMQGGVCQKATKPSDYKSFDYLYRFVSVSHQPKDVPLVEITKQGFLGIEPTSSAGLYGYQSGNVVILPCQLTSASTFEDNCAIVALNGQKGILKYIDGSSFDVSLPISHHNFYSGNTISCTFNLSTPAVWRGKDLEVVCKDENGTSMILKPTADSYSFDVTPSTTCNKTFSLKIFSEGLLLHENTLMYSFTRKERCATCGLDKDKCEFHGSHPIITPTGTKITEKKCKTCGKPLSECEYRGVH